MLQNSLLNNNAEQQCVSAVMGEVIKFRKPSLKEKHKGKTLCGNGFHKWVVEQNKQFDVKRGQLVTLYKCARCGATKTKTH